MDDEFVKAMMKLPPPLVCFSNGAACPWCGVVHTTVTFGENNCIECGRYFCFGYPDWHPGLDPISHVPFPHKEFSAVGGRADLMPDWEPTDLLKLHYHENKVRETGISAPKQ